MPNSAHQGRPVVTPECRNLMTQCQEKNEVILTAPVGSALYPLSSFLRAGKDPAGGSVSWLSRSSRQRSRRKGQLCLAPPDLLAQEETLRSIILTIASTSNPQTRKPCNPRYFKTACLCGFQIVRSGCHSADCPECAPAVRQQRAERARRRISSVRKGRPVLETVFTIPPEYRPNFANPKLFRDLVRRVWKLLQEQYGGEFAFSASHPIGSGDEKQDPGLFHPHINLIWLRKPGASGYLDVDRLRSDFAGILGTSGPVDLWHKYAYKAEEIWHILLYVCRPFPGFSSWTGPVRWLGKYPRKTKEEREKETYQAAICPECGQHREYMGRADRSDWIDYMARRSSERLLADLAKHEHSGPSTKEVKMTATRAIGQNDRSPKALPELLREYLQAFHERKGDGNAYLLA